MKNRKNIWLLALVLTACVLFGIWFVNRPKPMSGAKAIVIEVQDPEGSVKSYSGRTDAEYLSGAMDDFSAAGFQYEAVSGEYGAYVTTINGLKAEEKDSAYWAIYVQGEYGMYGIDQQPVTDGDTYRFAYETY
ncbi:MAG: DUF4430 domain-containing protein [Erysipelotrichaceae bacterium]|nr:DUF4430 domain-containing protein [Erysipelotrichaceae bacterium]